LVYARRAVLLAALLLGLLGAALPAAAQQLPPLQAPDVTNLVAPGGGDSSSVPTPGTAAPDVAAPTMTDAPDASAAGAAPDVITPPGPCGTRPITIARMTWPSAALLAEIHARILNAQFGCTVQVLPSDLAPTLSGMASSGQPAVAPEMWTARVPDQWNQAVKDQKLRQVGLSYADNRFEGWYVPDYVAAAHPELKSVAGLKADWHVFATGSGKGRFVSCPADWACAVLNKNMLTAQGLDVLFDVVEPKNRFDLDQTIASAVSRKEPILFYYWQPNAILAQFGFVPVDLGGFSKDDFACLGKRVCDALKPSSFAPEPVVIALAEWVFTGAPEVAAYLQRAQMPMDVMNKLLAQLNEPGGTVEMVADKFVAEQQPIWGKWVGAAAGAAKAP
jgi:glycine betaine/proline transport system substrate-binding protein